MIFVSELDHKCIRISPLSSPLSHHVLVMCQSRRHSRNLKSYSTSLIPYPFGHWNIVDSMSSRISVVEHKQLMIIHQLLFDAT
jgi:hypothetical protein